MGSSKKWANTISTVASSIYFLVIILQIPLFRVPCRAGICRTPLEVTSSHLIATKLFPPIAVKALLYPGAIANAFFNDDAIPTYNDFRNSLKFASLNSAPVTLDDLQRLEVLAGSYLSVVGAFVGLVKPGRKSLFGTLLVVWGLAREVILRKSAYVYYGKDIYIHPAMSIALVSAFLSIRKDVRKIFRSRKSRPVSKSKLV
ncbi:tail fiber [Parasponia andersonii]|uniref:Tail fiber n=1 Tax=Parasponia andersonii TaxID=3476 RepID=A0A2P5BQ87_PARAD|nr:tail fiber [Parasponia andersonii]